MRRSAESMIEHNFSDSLLIVSYALWNLIFWTYLVLYIAPILFWSWFQYQCAFNIVPYIRKMLKISVNISIFVDGALIWFMTIAAKSFSHTASSNLRYISWLRGSIQKHIFQTTYDCHILYWYVFISNGRSKNIAIVFLVK